MAKGDIVYPLFKSDRREHFEMNASGDGGKWAKEHYPMAVLRTTAEIMSFSRKIFDSNNTHWKKQGYVYVDDEALGWEVYQNQFVKKYLDTVNDLDRKKMSNVSATFPEESHTSGLHIYTLKFTDYRYLKKPHSIRIMLNDKDEIIQVEEVS